MSFLDAGRIGLISTIRDRLTASPRASLVGFGAGLPAWDEDGIPAVARETTALVAPLAYVTPFAVDFAKLRSEVVSPGPLPVIVDGIEYEPVVAPTALLLVRALLPSTFAAEDDQVLREVGLSLSPSFVGGLPPAQARFLPSELTAVGSMLLIRRFSPIPHDGSNSGTMAAFLVEL